MTKSMRFDFDDCFVNVIARHAEHASSVKPTKQGPMLSRRSVLLGAVAASAAVVPAFTAGPRPFNDAAFAEAQKTGQADFRRHPCLMVPDLQGAGADPRPADG